MTRWMWCFVGLCCSVSAYAGPGFDGVGDRGPMPRFERGPHAGSEPMVRDVQAREEAILEMLQEHDPSMYERLQRLKERDPHAYTAQLVSVARRMERLRQNPEARARFEEIRNLERQIRTQADEISGLSGTEREAAVVLVTELVEHLFEAKQAERRFQLTELRARIERLEKEIAERDTERDMRTRQYIDQLTVEKVEL